MNHQGNRRLSWAITYIVYSPQKPYQTQLLVLTQVMKDDLLSQEQRTIKGWCRYDKRYTAMGRSALVFVCQMFIVRENIHLIMFQLLFLKKSAARWMESLRIGSDRSPADEILLTFFTALCTCTCQPGYGWPNSGSKTVRSKCGMNKTSFSLYSFSFQSLNEVIPLLPSFHFLVIHFIEILAI